ncbi:MAG: 23S rRNA (guanosine(2251)-2'-O)-methyltransferase RlmB, partial [Actinomycetota bacterium]|nr:23S rRNA (guanosine(2251)-2'-O)-methyltransferase RlmB [Actinomycetota bacterium]
MAGNSQRRGAMRKPGTKKGAVTGSGGQKPKGLRGRKATPPAEMRPGHPAQRRSARVETRSEPATRTRRRTDAEPVETVLGRNPVLECLRAGVPATALHVALGIDLDDRVTDSVRLAADVGISILEVPRGDLDRVAGAALHQGIALQVLPYAYAHLDDVLAAARVSGDPPLLVALDGVTDPRNLGAVVRSAAAFGA